MNKDAQGRWKVGRSYIKLKMRVETLSELTVEILDEYRAQRKIGALTATQELQTLRQFCEFCVRRKWLAENPAKQIRPPKRQAKTC